MIRVSDEAKQLLSTLWAPDGEVLRLTASPEADSPGGLVFRHGRGEGADQIVQHAGLQVLRIDRSVRRGFDGSMVEAADGVLGVVPRDPVSETRARTVPFAGFSERGETAR